MIRIIKFVIGAKIVDDATCGDIEPNLYPWMFCGHKTLL